MKVWKLIINILFSLQKHSVSWEIRLRECRNSTSDSKGEWSIENWYKISRDSKGCYKPIIRDVEVLYFKISRSDRTLPLSKRKIKDVTTKL